MLKTRIDTALPPDLALARLRDGLRAGEDTAEEAPGGQVYGQVDGNTFSARRSALPQSNLHGELTGVVEASERGSTVRAHAMGADWAAVYAGAGLAASLYVMLLLGEATGRPEQFLLIVIGSCCLGSGVYSLASVFADWRYLIRHLRSLFQDTTA